MIYGNTCVWCKAYANIIVETNLARHYFGHTHKPKINGVLSQFFVVGLTIEGHTC